MSLGDSPIQAYASPKIANEALTELLLNGSLCLFLGAGVSQSTGSYPSWRTLVENCIVGANIKHQLPENPVTEDLLVAMDVVRESLREEDIKTLVQRFLQKDFTLDYSHAQNMLLIALGALVMTTRRGSIDQIITYNFDDLIEWYFDLHGYKTQVVSKLPYISQNSDVTVYHPHGFLPKSTKYKQSDHFIFDQLSYDLTIGRDDNHWFALSKQILLSKVAIMVGISGDDPAIRTLISRVNEQLIATNSSRPVAFLLNRATSIDKPLSYYTSRGIVPLGFGTYEEIWEFLLGICQNAACMY